MNMMTNTQKKKKESEDLFFLYLEHQSLTGRKEKPLFF